MIKIEENLGGIDFSIQFDDRINLLTEQSGTGKTFMLNMMADYLMLKGEPYAFFSRKTMFFSQDAMKEACVGKDIIIFDDADLYLTQELLDCASDIGTVIVSMKSFYTLSFRSCGFYSVEYSGNNLEVKRRFLNRSI